MKKLAIVLIVLAIFSLSFVYADNGMVQNNGQEKQIQNNEMTQNQSQENQIQNQETALISINTNAQNSYTEKKQEWIQAKETWENKKDKTNKEAMIQKGQDFLINALDKTEDYFLRIQEKLQEKDMLIVAEKLEEKIQTTQQIREHIQTIETEDDLTNYSNNIRAIWQNKNIVQNAIHLGVLYNAYDYEQKLEALTEKLNTRISILENAGYNVSTLKEKQTEIETEIAEAKEMYEVLVEKYKQMELEENYDEIEALETELQDFHTKVSNIRQEIATLVADMQTYVAELNTQSLVEESGVQ